MANIQFFSDAEKQHQVYPDIDPNGNYPGVTVGLANNLVSPDGVTDVGSFIYRSTGGSQDIADGYAQLQKIIGSTSSTTITENLVYNLITTGVSAITINRATFKTQISESGTYNFIYTPTITYSSSLVYSINKSTFANYVNMTTGTYNFTYTPVVAPVDSSSVMASFTAETFASKVNEEPGTYTFTYNGTNWRLDDANVTMSQYGIVTNGTEVNGSTIIVYYTSNSWYYNNSAVSMTNYGITTTGTESVGDTIAINYTANGWKLGTNNVTLSNYGIAITGGAAAIDDNIQVIFTAEQVGTIIVSNPTALFSVGLNQFDKEGAQILTGYTINTSGNVVVSANSYIIYFKCLGENTYTIYNNTASSIKRGAYSATPPTTSSTGLTVLTTVTTASSGQSLVNDTTHSYFQTSADGYMCIATTNIENLCCHLTWSGYNDSVYETYFDFTLPIPYEDDAGHVITTYGIPKVDASYYDEIDLEGHKYYKRVERIVYSAANLATVQEQTTHYIYDSHWIYYGIDTVTYNLSDTLSDAYRVSDFGTEEFLGTTLPLTATVFYQDNLRDKLRRSVEVVDNKVTEITKYSNNTEYPSARATFNMGASIWEMLGLSIDNYSSSRTYAVGDYVVKDNLLWKCISAVTSVSAWPTNDTLTYTTSGGSISSVNSSVFLASDVYAEEGMGVYTVTTTTYINPQTTATYWEASLTTPSGRVINDIDYYSSTLGIQPYHGSNSGTRVDTIKITAGGKWEKSYLFTAN